MRTITKTILFGATLCGAAFMAEDAKADPMTHDGFYLHLDVGLGYLSTSGEPLPGFEEKVGGLSVPSSLLLGGTVGPVVIGGGFLWHYLPSPTYSLNGTDADSSLDISMNGFGIGMFADIYPDPKSGLHFLPFVGYGGLNLTVEGNDSGNDPLGLLLALGAGYEFWVGNEWSIGPMLRFDYGAFSIEDTSYPTIGFSALASFTYH